MCDLQSLRLELLDVVEGLELGVLMGHVEYGSPIKYNMTHPSVDGRSHAVRFPATTKERD